MEGKQVQVAKDNKELVKRFVIVLHQILYHEGFGSSVG
jgi:hypothetical protein